MYVFVDVGTPFFHTIRGVRVCEGEHNPACDIGFPLCLYVLANNDEELSGSIRRDRALCSLYLSQAE